MKMPTLMKMIVAAAVAFVTMAPAVGAIDDEVPEIGEDEKEEKPKKKPRKKPEYRSFVEAEEVAKAWEQPILAFVDFGGEPLCAQIKMKLFDRNRPMQKEILGQECVFWHCTVPQWKDKSKNNQRQRSSKDRQPPKPDVNRLPDEDRLAITRISSGGIASYPMIALLDPSSNRTLAQMFFSDIKEATVGKFMRDFKDGMHQFGKKDWKIPPKVQKLIEREEKERARAERQKR